MSIRKLKRRGQEKHGHYDIYSYRCWGHENDPYGDLTEREALRNHRIRVGISRSRPWREHV